MCLYTKQICPIKARKDITVYKIFHHDLYRDCFYTPFYRTYAKIESILRAKGKMIFFTTVEKERTRCVFGGFIHCYTNLKYTHSMVQMGYCRNTCYNTVIAECTIPKGTLYFKSDDGKEICAQQVYVKQIVSE